MSELYCATLPAGSKHKNAKQKTKRKHSAEAKTTSALGKKTIYDGTEASEGESRKVKEKKRRKKKNKDLAMMEEILTWLGQDEGAHELAPPTETSDLGGETVHYESEAAEEVSTPVKGKKKKKKKRDLEGFEELPSKLREKQAIVDDMVAHPTEVSALGGQTVNDGNEASEGESRKMKEKKKKKKKKDMVMMEEIRIWLGEDEEAHDLAPPTETSALGGEPVYYESEAAEEVSTLVKGKKKKKKKRDLEGFEELPSKLGEEQAIVDDMVAHPTEASALGGQTVAAEESQQSGVVADEDDEADTLQPTRYSPTLSECGGWMEYDGPPLTGTMVLAADPDPSPDPPASPDAGPSSVRASRAAYSGGAGKPRRGRSRTTTKRNRYACQLEGCAGRLTYVNLPRHIRRWHPQFAHEACAQAKRMRQMAKTLREEQRQPTPRRRWRCCVPGCSSVVINLPEHLDRHFQSRTGPQFQEAYDGAELVLPVEEEVPPAMDVPAVFTRYADYLRGVPGGCKSEHIVQRYIRALRLWLPEVTELPLERQTTEHLFRALSGPLLACEKHDGWIKHQQVNGRLRMSTLRAQIRAISDFLHYAISDAVALGVDAKRWSPMLSTMKERLSGWRRTLRTTDRDAERHYSGQAERIISLEEQERFLQSDLARSMQTIPGPEELPTLQTARTARNRLMTMLLVRGVGRPSHVTGIEAKHLETARDAELAGRSHKLIRNWSFKTARQHRHEVPCRLETWQRLCFYRDHERPLLLAAGGGATREDSGRLFINQGGSRIDSSNAGKIFKSVWLEAMGTEADVPDLTSRGIRYGTVIGMTSLAPEQRGDVAASMAHSKDTQLGVYDVHGGVAVSARLRGHDAIIRERERLCTAEDNSRSSDSEWEESPGITCTASPAAAQAAADSTNSPAAAAGPSAEGPTAAAVSRGPRPPKRQTAGRQERTTWSPAESQALAAACRDFITGQKRRYDSRDISAEVSQMLGRFTAQQVYDKAKYLRKRHTN